MGHAYGLLLHMILTAVVEVQKSFRATFTFGASAKKRRSASRQRGRCFVFLYSCCRLAYRIYLFACLLARCIKPATHAPPGIRHLAKIKITKQWHYISTDRTSGHHLMMMSSPPKKPTALISRMVHTHLGWKYRDQLVRY